MKNLLLILLTAILLFGIVTFSGCDSKETNQNDIKNIDNEEIYEDVENYDSPTNNKQNDTQTNNKPNVNNNASTNNNTQTNSKPNTNNTQTNSKPNTNNTQTSSKPSTNNNSNHTHSYDNWKIVSEATCTSNGTQQRSCSCGDSQTQTINALKHSYLKGKCICCNSQQPLQRKTLGFGDSISFYYEYSDAIKGEVSISVGTSYQNYSFSGIYQGNYVSNKRFIRIPIEIKNIGDSPCSLNANVARYLDSNNRRANPGDYYIWSGICFEDGDLDKELQPGEKFVGAIYIESTGSGTYSFIIKDNKYVEYTYKFSI